MRRHPAAAAVEPVLLAALALLLLAPAGCKELSQTFEEAEQQTEATRIGGPKNEQEARKRQAQERAARPDFDMDDHKKSWGGAVLPANSPEARLKAAIIGRLECEDRQCSKAALKKIRAGAKLYAPVLDKLFEGQGPEVTMEALRLAGLLKATPAIPALGMVAVKADGQVRKEAIWALGATGDASAVPELKRLVETGVGWEARSDVCGALAALASHTAVPMLVKLVRDEHPAVRADCARALGATKSVAAIEPLASLVRESDPKVLSAAVHALDQIEGAKAKAAKVQLAARLAQLAPPQPHTAAP
jgi:hypothetical protein